MMQRNMSYRKPAPVYIPSPPPSPRASSVHSEAPKQPEEEIPPLPNNWREILVAKISEDNSSRENSLSINPSNGEDPATKEPYVTEPAPPPAPQPKMEKDSNVQVEGYEGSFATLSGSQAHRGRGLPTEYRPPTPPLRSKSKRQDVPPEINSEGGVGHSDMHLPRGIYPSNNHSNLYYGYARTGAGASLRTSTSFQTERTAVSLNPSMGWSRGMGILSDKGMHSYPNILIRKETAVVSDDASLSGGISCWKLDLASWAKKLRSFVVIHK
ncbi:hypothetical protein BDZ97DRAFT_1773862 [Flammula alnicola]|nr:hypothetical protein BDZ97DRAFT_1773862 [Flammula alnicola]